VKNKKYPNFAFCKIYKKEMFDYFKLLILQTTTDSVE